MVNESKSHKTHTVFRWFAGFTCPAFLVMAVGFAFPTVDAAFPAFGFPAKPDYVAAAVFFLGAFFLGTVAATGRFDFTRSKQL